MANLITTPNNKVLASNYYQVKFDSAFKLYKYSISTSPENPNEHHSDFLRELMRNCHKQIRSRFDNDYFDLNNTIYSQKVLDTFSLEDKVTVGDKEYSVNVNPKGSIQTDSPEAMGLLGRLFKSIQGKLKLERVGRKFFNKDKKKAYADLKLEVWPGFETSVQLISNNYLVQVDSAFKTVRQATIYDAIKECKQKNQDLDETLAGQTVMTSYNGKFYRINKIDPELTVSCTFKDKKDNEKTYSSYYQEKYNIKIKDESQPLIKVIEKMGKQKIETTFYLVPELCQTTGLTDQMRADFQVMKKLAEATKPKAFERINQAKDFIDKIKQDGENIVKAWNVEIIPVPVQCTYKQINAGNMIMEQGKKNINIATGNLDRDTQCGMFEQAPLTTWAVMCSEQDGQLLNQFMQTIQQCIQSFNYPCSKPITMSIKGRNADDWIKQLQQAPNNITLVIMILNGRKKAAPHYDALKRFTIRDKPIATQCILSSTIQQALKGGGKLRSICNKLLVQINAKAAGVPWAISDMPFANEPTMVCGIDVYHQTKMGKQSIMAFVATFDKNLCKYWSTAQMHETGQEITTHIQPAFKRALMEYKEINGCLPKQVIVYRDGVSGAQQKAVTEMEIPAMQAAAKEVDASSNIKIVCICVNKRVNAKFYAANSMSNLQGADNPTPGTVVDDKVCTTKDGNDFFLIAQKTNQGSATPTHYHIIHNDLGNDQIKPLQVLTYKLCYLYYNWTGSIKTPAPVRYAHTLSNFIGDRYNHRNPDSAIIPHDEFNKKKCLYYI